jgi:hypothetical protein
MVDFKWPETQRANGLDGDGCQYLNRVTLGTTQSSPSGQPPRVIIVLARYAYDLWKIQIWARCEASKNQLTEVAALT